MANQGDTVVRKQHDGHSRLAPQPFDTTGQPRPESRELCDNKLESATYPPVESGRTEMPAVLFDLDRTEG